MASLVLPWGRRAGAALYPHLSWLKAVGWLAHVTETQSPQQAEKGPHFTARETEVPQCEVQLRTQAGISPGVPSKAQQGRARGSGGREERPWKGFPSPIPQHLPPLSAPPHWPGCEIKTNWGPGLPQGLRRGKEGPHKERFLETE